MRILVVGGGGREHALVWKLARDSSGPELFCAPGNAGTAGLADNVPIRAEDLDGLALWAAEHRPDLTVVGPEAPLCAGLTDRLESIGLKVFGPRAEAAQLEGSKVFAKEVMTAAKVPTAQARVFTDASRALDYARSVDGPVVVKADGLAAGKGVIVCADEAEATDAVRRIMMDREFGLSGSQVLVEECLEGQEASILALVDGRSVVMLASSQDHKRVFDHDRGSNTGGMGAYSPAPVVTDGLWPTIREQVFGRALAELGRRGIVYRGVLYAGLMMTASGPKVLEFNCRFGDPEVQAILPRMEGDLLPALEACADGTLSDDLIRWRPDACVCVVMASGGYPGAYETGKEISGLDEAGALEGVTVFHAGTRREGGRVVTAGGRVLGVTALGADLAGAVRQAYKAVSAVRFQGAHFRSDIGYRALSREGS